MILETVDDLLNALHFHKGKRLRVQVHVESLEYVWLPPADGSLSLDILQDVLELHVYCQEQPLDPIEED